jgi:hypothetical protein
LAWEEIVVYKKKNNYFLELLAQPLDGNCQDFIKKNGEKINRKLKSALLSTVVSEHVYQSAGIMVDYDWKSQKVSLAANENHFAIRIVIETTIKDAKTILARYAYHPSLLLERAGCRVTRKILRLNGIVLFDTADID